MLDGDWEKSTTGGLNYTKTSAELLKIMTPCLEHVTRSSRNAIAEFMDSFPLKNFAVYKVSWHDTDRDPKNLPFFVTWTECLLMVPSSWAYPQTNRLQGADWLYGTATRTIRTQLIVILWDQVIYVIWSFGLASSNPIASEKTGWRIFSGYMVLLLLRRRSRYFQMLFIIIIYMYSNVLLLSYKRNKRLLTFSQRGGRFYLETRALNHNSRSEEIHSDQHRSEHQSHRLKPKVVCISRNGFRP